MMQGVCAWESVCHCVPMRCITQTCVSLPISLLQTGYGLQMFDCGVIGLFVDVAQVHLLVRSSKLRASGAMIDRVKENPKITLHLNTQVVDAFGDSKKMLGLDLVDTATGASAFLPSSPPSFELPFHCSSWRSSHLSSPLSPPLT